MTTIETKIAELGLTLPKPSAPVASYVPVRRSGNLLYISGQLSIGPDGLVKGTLGGNISVEGGQQAAEFCALNILGQVAAAGFALETIQAVLKLTVLVASTPDFTEQHLVANGASDLFIKLLGDEGKHARAAFGVSALPLGAAVEIDATIEITS